MTATATASKIRLKVLRQAGEKSNSHWEEFVIPFREKLNVISALMEVQKNPQTVDGKSVSPPAWDGACLEEVCGSCTMIINGTVRQACTALIEEVGQVQGDEFFVELKPMSKFPVMRDLVVDRSKMFENLIKVKAWSRLTAPTTSAPRLHRTITSASSDTLFPAACPAVAALKLAHRSTRSRRLLDLLPLVRHFCSTCTQSESL